MHTGDPLDDERTRSSRDQSDLAVAGRSAPSCPAPAPPERLAGSVRRTSHVDMHWDLPADADPFATAGLHLRGSARDLLTRGVGASEILGEAQIDARVDDEGGLAALHTAPRAGDVAALLGVRVGAGFRQRAETAFPGEAGTPLGLLIDDLPVAALISGYARVRRAMTAGAHPGDLAPRAAADHQTDLCSGWAAGGTMIRSILDGQGIPYRRGPLAPRPAPDDPEGWHPEPPLPPGAMRRRRRIDVVPASDAAASLRIDAMFRDTWMDLEGREEVLHEYTVEATLDPAGERIQTISADPRVLPFGECPAAARYVSKLDGLAVAGLRRSVRETLVSTESCTHLNDLLRALADVTFLRERAATGDA